ncbi:MAG: histidine kinase dimerization/phosphoacceptor domain -containing protein [Celeribacter sp.]
MLDTEREEEFDELVLLAAAICETPVALVSFVDADRQWFKAETGLGVRETTLDKSICAHTILQEDFLEIEDTSVDPRTVENPLVCAGPQFRFYAGAVMRSDDGLPLGSFCVLDHKPRKLTETQRKALRALANQVTRTLELRRSVTEAETLRQEVDHRVKNSLQTVAALTRLQARAAEGEEAKALLAVVERRIGTVAALHEEMYRTGAGGRINLRTYLNNVGQLIDGARPPNIELHIEPEALKVTSRQASALAVIVNEFTTNSFKHAFPDGQPGEIRVTTELGEDGIAQLICADNGAGLKTDSDGHNSLGLRIIDASASQIGGTAEMLDGNPGLTTRITFPLHMGS